MCTSYERSFFQVLKPFEGGKVLDDNHLYRILGDEVLRLTLGGATVREFLESLAQDRYLERKRNGYKLLPKGRQRIDQLAELVKAA